MSFGYGVGDVIAGAALISQLIALLDESTGAGAHYRRLKTELQSLQDTLTQVQFIDLEHSQHESRIALEQTAGLCKETIEEFISEVERKIRKYDSGLSKKQPIWKLKSTFRKMQWNVYDFDSFGAAIRGHKITILSLIAFSQMTTVSVIKRQNQEILQRLEARMAVEEDSDAETEMSYVTARSVELQAVEDYLVEEGRQHCEKILQHVELNHTHAHHGKRQSLVPPNTQTPSRHQLQLHALASVMENLSFQQHSTDQRLQDMQLAAARNSAEVFQAIQEMKHRQQPILERIMMKIWETGKQFFKSAMSSQRWHGLSMASMSLGKTFAIEDALGGKFEFPLGFIGSQRMLHVALLDHFATRSKAGLFRIETNQYSLQNKKTGQELDLSQPLTKVFKPGADITVVMTFRRRKSKAGYCPRCAQVNMSGQSPKRTKVQCRNKTCRLIYSRKDTLDVSVVHASGQSGWNTQKVIKIEQRLAIEEAGFQEEKNPVGIAPSTLREGYERPPAYSEVKTTDMKDAMTNTMEPFKRVQISTITPAFYDYQDPGLPDPDALTDAYTMWKPIEKEHGPHHPETLAAVQNCAIIHQSQGQFSKAEEMYRRVLEGHERLYGSGHAETLLTVQNLASTFRRQGRFEEAEPMNIRVMQGFEKLKGPEHPKTLLMVYDLAFTYSFKQDWDKAETLYLRTLDGFMKRKGPSHPSTLNTMQSLANDYESQRRYDNADELYKQVLIGFRKILGDDHPATLNAVHDVATFQSRIGSVTNAEELFRLALYGREDKLGLEHPATDRTREALADLLVRQGKAKGAEEVRMRACMKKPYGPDPVLPAYHALL